jgi:hypothetical protein
MLLLGKARVGRRIRPKRVVCLCRHYPDPAGFPACPFTNAHRLFPDPFTNQYDFVDFSALWWKLIAAHGKPVWHSESPCPEIASYRIAAP